MGKGTNENGKIFQMTNYIGTKRHLDADAYCLYGHVIISPKML